MGKALWESHGNGTWSQNWEWEGMGIDCTGMGGSGDVKSHSRLSVGYSTQKKQQTVSVITECTKSLIYICKKKTPVIGQG